MRFTDLPDDNWAYNFVAYLFCNGIISGYSDGTFRPGESTTRAQISKMIVLGSGWSIYTPYFPDFSDVPVDSPYYSFIETAFIRGVISGYSDGTFHPGSPVTRAQVTKMLVLAANWEQQFPSYPDFLDVGPGDWSYSFIETAFLHGIVSGYSDGTFRPGYAVNRAQFAKMLTLELQSPRTAPAVPRDAPGSTPTPAAKR